MEGNINLINETYGLPDGHVIEDVEGLAIAGQGYVLNALGNKRAVFISNSDVTLMNLELTNASTDTQGAGVYVNTAKEAKTGVEGKSLLPSSWNQHFDPVIDRPYSHNPATGMTTWHDPTSTSTEI